LKNALEFLLIKFLAVQNQIGIFETAVMRFFLFPDPRWNKIHRMLGEVAGGYFAMPPPKFRCRYIARSNLKPCA
jgi:hypothetical protein